MKSHQTLLAFGQSLEFAKLKHSSSQRPGVFRDVNPKCLVKLQVFLEIDADGNGTIDREELPDLI